MSRWLVLPRPSTSGPHATIRHDEEQFGADPIKSRGFSWSTRLIIFSSGFVVAVQMAVLVVELCRITCDQVGKEEKFVIVLTQIAFLAQTTEQLPV